MTDVLNRGAANQAGAHINPNAEAEAQDFLPLKGIDHVEFWVGNAKQAAHYYRALWGFTPVAYAGLETGVRDRSSFVMVQNDIRFVFTAPLTPDGEIAEHVATGLGRILQVRRAQFADPRHVPFDHILRHAAPLLAIPPSATA